MSNLVIPSLQVFHVQNLLSESVPVTELSTTASESLESIWYVIFHPQYLLHKTCVV